MKPKEAIKILRDDASKRNGGIFYEDERLRLFDAASILMTHCRSQTSYLLEKAVELESCLTILGSPTKLRQTSGGVHQVVLNILSALDTIESSLEPED